jgi:hypothetical protein
MRKFNMFPSKKNFYTMISYIELYSIYKADETDLQRTCTGGATHRGRPFPILDRVLQPSQRFLIPLIARVFTRPCPGDPDL